MTLLKNPYSTLYHVMLCKQIYEMQIKCDKWGSKYLEYHRLSIICYRGEECTFFFR